MNRISPAFLVVLFFAILIGLAGVYAFNRYLNRTVAPPASPTEKLQRVVLASTDLPAGRVIHSSDMMNVMLTREQFSKRKWPEVMMSDGKQIINRMLKNPVKKGEAFTPETFYSEGDGPDLTQRLAPGLRAVTITVKPSGLPSAATPGAQVDVIFRITPTKDLTIPEVTRVLMQGVEILAIGENSTKGLRSTINPKSDTQTVILALSGDQAMRLKAAEGHGELSLALRGPHDSNQSLENSNLTLRELLELPPIVAAPPPTPPFVTEIYRRGRRETLSFGPMGIITSSPNKRAAPLPAPSDDLRQAPDKPGQDHIIPAPPAEPPFLPGPDRPQVPPGDKDQKLTNQVIEYRSKIIPDIPLAAAA